MNRREFNQAAASAALSFNILPSGARGRLERPTLAGIGIGGKGRSDLALSLIHI